MSWTTPADWDYKEAPGSEKLNQQIRDNLNYLKLSTPVGVVLDYAGATAPDQFLLCNGAAVSRSTYSALYAVVGVTYGAGDGSTTFNVPDCRGRCSVGAGQGSSLTNRVLAAIFGTETHTLTEAQMPSHTHVQDPHRHYYRWNNDTVSEPYPGGGDSHSNNMQWSEYTTAINQYTGGGGAHANTQPSIVLNKIIKY